MREFAGIKMFLFMGGKRKPFLHSIFTKIQAGEMVHVIYKAYNFSLVKNLKGERGALRNRDLYEVGTYVKRDDPRRPKKANQGK